MTATSTPGIWTEEVLPGIVLTIDTNINVISVVNTYGSNIKYEYPDGIYGSHLEQVRDSILRTTKLSSIRVEA